MIPAEIPEEILLPVAKVISQAEADGWHSVGAAGLYRPVTDEELIEGIAARVMALKARGYGS